MTENEAYKFIAQAVIESGKALEALQSIKSETERIGKIGEYYANLDNCVKEIEACRVAMIALEEIQQYRAYKEIFEGHFSKEALELLSDKEEFSKWIERGKWIAKKCDEINRKLEGFEAIGTIEEFKDLKEKSEPKKPLCVSMAKDKDKNVGSVGRCPCCNDIVSEDMLRCDECGQKLDWN